MLIVKLEKNIHKFKEKIISSLLSLIPTRHNQLKLTTFYLQNSFCWIFLLQKVNMLPETSKTIQQYMKIIIFLRSS